MEQKETILSVNNLTISFDTMDGELHAVRGVTFDLKEGETLAIVGESGSGKSVATKAINQLLNAKNVRIKDGEIIYRGENLLLKSEKEMTKIRGEEIAMIFQDPMTSLNPTLTVGFQIAESLITHQNMKKQDAMQEAIVMMEKVGIGNAEARSKMYPHQFSGGMRQRVMIAIALACNPKILIADEPTTALDVTIQAQIINLMNELKSQLGTSIIFITHDLGVVANIADRVAVMYAGKIVEVGTATEIFFNPQHPYTWGLMASMPTLSTEDKDLYTIPGSPPNLINKPVGDPFAIRNEFALEIDFIEEPEMFKVSETHYAATWLLDKRAPKVTPPLEIQERHKFYKKLMKKKV